MKRQATDWGKISVNNIFDKDLVSETYSQNSKKSKN